MLVCGPDYSFYYASARWPGSVHDNRVLRNSSLYQTWEIEGIFLLGNLLIFYIETYHQLELPSPSETMFHFNVNIVDLARILKILK